VIFVTVGTSTFGFERLLHGVDELEVDEEVVVQYGASAFVPSTTVAEAFMPYPTVVERMREARMVIAHGGVGSILTALHVGHRPVIVPRQAHDSEAVDDHQLELAVRLAEIGLIELVTDVGLLGAAVAAVRDGASRSSADSALVDAVREFVDSALAVA
jgi:UDP-N-acetylglucosamine transferase subunit ALG13